MGIRAANRERLEQAILEVAEEMLGTEGATGLTLRGVAGRVGISPSAIYRYYNGIDALLTALIMAAYRDIGAAAREAADRSVGQDALDRIEAVGLAVRAWALAHPHRYSLIYGTPVPGYAAPEETIAPASEVGEVLVEILRSASPRSGAASAAMNATTAERLGLPTDVAARAVLLWTALFGMISFELYGHWANVVEDPEGYLRAQVRRLARDVLG